MTYEFRDDDGPSAHIAERRPPPAPTPRADPAPAPTPPKAARSEAVGRLAWDLYFAREPNRTTEIGVIEIAPVSYGPAAAG